MSKKMELHTYITIPDTPQKMLALNTILRRATVYPYPYLAIKYATIDAQVVVQGKSQLHSQGSTQQLPFASSVGQASNSKEYINEYKIQSIFALAKDDNYLLGGLRSQVYGHQDAEERQLAYCNEFKHTKNTTLGIQIECRGDNVRIEDSFIADSVIIYENAEIVNCIILERAKVGGRLTNCIIGKEAVLVVKEAENVVIGGGASFVNDKDDKVMNKFLG